MVCEMGPCEKKKLASFLFFIPQALRGIVHHVTQYGAAINRDGCSDLTTNLIYQQSTKINLSNQSDQNVSYPQTKFQQPKGSKCITSTT
jgi:hypothetical protein